MSGPPFATVEDLRAAGYAAPSLADACRILAEVRTATVRHMDPRAARLAALLYIGAVPS